MNFQTRSWNSKSNIWQMNKIVWNLLILKFFTKPFYEFWYTFLVSFRWPLTRPNFDNSLNGSLLKVHSKSFLTVTGEDSKLVYRRKRPKVDTLFSSLFSDASERRVWLSAESKILASTFGRFRLYRLKPIISQNLKNFSTNITVVKLIMKPIYDEWTLAKSITGQLKGTSSESFFCSQSGDFSSGNLPENDRVNVEQKAHSYFWRSRSKISTTFVNLASYEWFHKSKYTFDKSIHRSSKWA